MTCRGEMESEEAFSAYMESASEMDAAVAIGDVRKLFLSFRYRHGALGMKACARMEALQRIGEEIFDRRFGYLPLPF